MDPELHKFAQQLSVWTDLIIENGRTPFRRVDLYPGIYTEQGLLRPPLVFWINRQSMMAGGILLLPKQNLELELQRGLCCSAALGLKHFVTWESDRVRIWQRHGEHARQHLQFDLKNTGDPNAFRYLLGEVLEALKLLAVIGLVPNRELTPHYLHNLFQTTLELALPALINSYRSQRAEEAVSAPEDADQLANEANRMLLLQLLGASWYEKLPSAILPEKLERAIQLSLPQLPDALSQSLSMKVTKTPPELPLETVVCFHHLLLRLRQLSWRQPEDRASTCIQLLINSWDNHTQIPDDQVLIYPQSPIIGPQTQLVLSNSPSLLAAVRLLENLNQQSEKELQIGNLFQFDYADRTDLTLNGKIDNPRLLTREERQQYAILLRTSWPNRRFRITSDKSLWFWELIHLLGLSKQQRKLTLTLPHAVLQSSATEPFWLLLWENYSIHRLTYLNKDLIRLELNPGTGQEEAVSVCRGDQKRTFLTPDNLPQFRNRLLLALELAPEIYSLLSDKLVWPETEELDNSSAVGLQIYLQSRLCQRLEQILGLDLQSLAVEEQRHELLGFPRPDQLHLIELARSGTIASEQSKTPDRLLAELLQSPVIEAIEVPAGQLRKNTVIPRGGANKGLQDELVQRMQKTGIPAFPEQYLYFLDNPKTSVYHLTPPLTTTSELLGEVVLEDAAGKKFQVYGEELANALLLCAALGKTEVELPADRHQLAILQQQYWQDLKQLHKQLNSLCHGHLQSPKSANKLVKKVWKRLQLPKLP